MDSIKPEKDDVDYHRLQKSRPSKPAEQREARESALPGNRSAGMPRSGQWLVMSVLLVAVALVGVGYWQVSQQQQTIKKLDSQLELASSYISQSKMIVAGLEGQINQTDAAMVQSGNEMARELKFLDSEMRKLWDVTNKRNKTWIQSNQKSLKALSADVDGLKKSAGETATTIADLRKGMKSIVLIEKSITGIQADVARQEGQLSSQQLDVQQQGELLAAQGSSLNEHQGQVKADFENLYRESTQLSANQQALTEQLVSSVADVEKKMASQAQTVQAISKKVSGAKPGTDVDGRLKSLEASMVGLDKVRGQLVQRIVQLDERINEVQLELDSL